MRIILLDIYVIHFAYIRIFHKSNTNRILANILNFTTTNTNTSKDNASLGKSVTCIYHSKHLCSLQIRIKYVSLKYLCFPDSKTFRFPISFTSHYDKLIDGSFQCQRRVVEDYVRAINTVYDP